jgi:serine/threonine protein kinase/tetratricopeptide (TPR) repeat protein
MGQADRTESLFAAAVALSRDERAGFLDAECPDDPAMRRRVEALLRAHERAGHLLDNPVPGSSERTAEYVCDEVPGTFVAGRYKLLEAVGEGGMGTVWVAEQVEPVRRKVAVKLIKAGMDSKSVLARFEAERQALALMDHPNIAKVFDGGLTDAGRPFFAMEYVKGVPIVEYCDAARLCVPERLRLFAHVCQAVQHAHQKGIIHRDLKPSNILVAPYDDRPVPKIIDFGLAKATQQSLTERTLHTAHEAVLGTPLYMSPEQAQLNNLDIDTRSDIYSLGVLLYELLTGTTPLEKRRFKQAAWDEVRRIIREEEPPKPSTRLSSTDMLPSLAAGRQTEPLRLTKMVRGELDWIVMKALEKDRNRRYETANGFALDIERFLAKEPVLAAPPNARYRLRKFARKHRAALTTAATIALLLVAGVAASTWQAIRASRAESEAVAARVAEAKERAKAVAERDDKEQARAAEAQQRRLADEARDQANEEAAVAKAVSDFLQHDLLAEADPSKNPRNEAVSVEELLMRAANRIDDKFNEQPRVEAAIRSTIGATYLLLGMPANAVPHLECALEIRQRVLGPEDRETIGSMIELATALMNLGRFDKAEALKVKAMEISSRILGDDDPVTLTAMNNLAGQYAEQGELAKAAPLYFQALERTRRVHGDDDLLTLAGLNNLAVNYMERGQFAEAEPLLVKALEGSRRIQGEEHPRTLQIMGTLGRVYQDRGQYAKAESLIAKALEAQVRVLGAEHEETLMNMNNLAFLYKIQRAYAKAEPLYVKVLETSRHVLGDEHPRTLVYANNMGGLYRSLGKLAEAEAILVKTLEAQKRILGEEHSSTLATMGNLESLYKTEKLFAKAETLALARLQISRRVLGEEHPDTIAARSNLGRLHADVGNDHARAEPILRDVLNLRRRVLGDTHPDTIDSMHHLAVTLHSLGNVEQAIPLFVEKLGVQEARLGVGHPDTIRTAFNLAVNYRDGGRLDDAVAMFDEWLARAKSMLPPDHPVFCYGATSAVPTYERADQQDKAAKWKEELAASHTAREAQESEP